MEVYRSLFKKVLYPTYESLLLKRKTFTYYNDYILNNNKSKEELEIIQFEKLKKLIEHCNTNVPYYRELWKKIDFNPMDMDSISVLDQLPILTKEIVKENYDDLIAKNYNGALIKKATGGSTGMPFKFAITRESYEQRTSIMWRGYEWADAEVGRRTAYIWGADFESTFLKQFKLDVYNYFYNRKIFNIFDIKNDYSTIVKKLNKFKAKVIVSYTTPLYELSRYILENNVNICSPEVIITGAEPLFDYQREVIEKAFSIKMTNTYGCREVMLIASECNQHNGLHINIDHLYIEINQQTSALYADNTGEILITDLSNYGMPFIKYKNGDLITLTNRKCECGLEFPLIEKVEGRVLDAIRLPNNEIISGELFPHYLKDFDGIEQYQIVQETYLLINLNLVINDKYESQIEDVIRKGLYKIIPEDIVIKFNYLDQIPKTGTGKTRITISKVLQ